MLRTTIRNLPAKPGETISISFFVFIVIGAILLMLPVATADGEGTSLVDAFFTSTSAMCVTGLIVQDTTVYFSRFGHIVILTLMQLGGLGIMTSYAFFSIAIGKRLLISQQVAMKGVLDNELRCYLDPGPPCATSTFGDGRKFFEIPSDFAVGTMIKLFGHMKGSYTGHYPTNRLYFLVRHLPPTPNHISPVISL